MRRAAFDGYDPAMTSTRIALLGLASITALSLTPSARAQQRRPETPTATLEVTSASGALAMSEVTSLADRTRRPVERCAAQRTERRTEEVTTFELSVDVQGRVHEATALVNGPEQARRMQSEPQAAEWLGCVTAALERVRLPRRPEPSTLRVRVTFTPANATASGVPETSAAGSLGPRRGGAPGGAATLAEPASTTASYPREAIRRVAREHDAEVRHCHEIAAGSRPGLSGSLTVRITIAADGTVTQADTEADEVHAPELTSCMLAALRRWTFPVPVSGGSAAVSYPFVFRSHDAHAE